jgi:hypothetical protein
MWLALLPTAKSSLMLYITSVPYERAVKYHRIVTSLGVLLSILHVLVNIANIPTATLLSGDPYGMHQIDPTSGMLAFATILLMSLLAFESVRRAHYRVSMFIHKNLWLVAVVLMTLHIWKSPYPLRAGFAPGILLHMWDWGRRIISVLTMAKGTMHTLRPVHGKRDEEKLMTGGTDIVHLSVTVPSKQSPLKELHNLLMPLYLWTNTVEDPRRGSAEATMDSFDGLGQYYFLGGLSGEWHPITVSRVRSDGTSGEKKLEFHFRAVGPWTKGMASTCSRSGDGTQSSDVRVALDGPYGSLRIDISAYSDLIFIAGGIGITPILPILDRLHNLTSRERKTGYFHLRRIRVIWACKQDIAEELIEEFGDRIYGRAAESTMDSVKVTVSPSVSLDRSGKKSRGKKRGVRGGTVESKEQGFTPMQQAHLADEEFAISSYTSSGLGPTSGSSYVNFEFSFHVTPSSGRGSVPKTYSTASGMRVLAESVRPDMESVITKASFDAAKDGGSVGVVVCGPKTMSIEATNFCHQSEVDVHVESFEY